MVTKLIKTVVTIIWASLLLKGVEGSKSAEKLYKKLMTNYSPYIRPVSNDTDLVIVHLGVALSQLVDIDEQNQLMITSVWVKQTWTDVKLTWNPEDYGGIDRMKIPIDQLWSPDLVLYNTSADGSYAVEVVNSATVFYDGTVQWNPPASFRSSCNIDIEYFPFDMQHCFLKFGSWTYDGSVMDLLPVSDQVGRENYRVNGEWEIKNTPVKRYALKYPCCEEIYVDVRFNFILKRNPLFYIITLVIPCILISFLTLLVFYLPSDAQEKITLSISVLLALIVFLLLIPSIVPPTSKTIPLMGRYMLFTMGIVSLSIVATVVTINLHFRTIMSHKMPKWIRRVFLEILPKVLLMERPDVLAEKKEKKLKKKLQKEALRKYNVPYSFTCMDDNTPVGIRPNGRPYSKIEVVAMTPSLREEIEGRDSESSHAITFRGDSSDEDDHFASPSERNCKEILRLVKAIVQIMKDGDEGDEVEEEWRYVGLVIDRLLLYVFTVVVVVGTVYMFIQPPSLWEKPGQYPELVWDEPIILEETRFSSM
ncbi:Neuronal acetylcholine receptor subunit alpha-6 [Holothuria leucospilota]|uniref:Neuronal acetylcholine receptor subunit alpha-6 n=1 Tax=Holothuria leucospilota TaxID=206669 RepID=A0A9Q1CED1_HOLLE|nr:Neuronal acetylcholine receptor subunit alpha-6 [Holothuria leucospilota]